MVGVQEAEDGLLALGKGAEPASWLPAGAAACGKRTSAGLLRECLCEEAWDWFCAQFLGRPPEAKAGTCWMAVSAGHEPTCSRNAQAV